jgi:type 1 glutamine amidotransferase
MVTLLKTSNAAPWHPWPKYRQFIEPLFAEASIVETAEWDGRVEGGLLVSLADEWDRPVSDQAAARLVDGVTNGGRLLVLHQGISLQERPELAALIGGRFAGHPAEGPLSFRIPGSNAVWTMTDEPYRFEAVGDVVPLLEYEHEGQWYLGGWEHRPGRGRVVYLMPGHVPENFTVPEYRSLILSYRDRLLDASDRD